MNPKNRGFIRACRPRVRKKLKNSEKRFAKTGSKTGANQQKPKGRTTAFSPESPGTSPETRRKTQARMEIACRKPTENQQKQPVFAPNKGKQTVFSTVIHRFST
jgi:hypothetical protein